MDSIKILYEDSQITVCVKPAGILSQTGKTGEASMVTQLETQLGTSIYPVHRLDREAAGVMVYAKTERGAADLSRQIQSGKLEKEYLAVVQGRPRPDQGMLTDFLYHDQRKNKTYVVKRPRKGVKEARLLYRVLMEREHETLVQIRLLTGRTHQIRVQFASRRWPLAGDGRYGGGSGTMQLWSMRLSFLTLQMERRSFVELPDAMGSFSEIEMPEALNPSNFLEM